MYAHLHRNWNATGASGLAHHVTHQLCILDQLGAYSMGGGGGRGGDRQLDGSINRKIYELRVLPREVKAHETPEGGDECGWTNQPDRDM